MTRKEKFLKITAITVIIVLIAAVGVIKIMNKLYEDGMVERINEKWQVELPEDCDFEVLYDDVDGFPADGNRVIKLHCDEDLTGEVEVNDSNREMVLDKMADLLSKEDLSKNKDLSDLMEDIKDGDITSSSVKYASDNKSDTLYMLFDSEDNEIYLITITI